MWTEGLGMRTGGRSRIAAGGATEALRATTGHPPLAFDYRDIMVDGMASNLSRKLRVGIIQAGLNDAIYARHPPKREMSVAPATPSGSTKKPLTLDPSASRTVPIVKGDGTFATKAPKAAGSSAQTSAFIETPAPSATRTSPGFSAADPARAKSL